MFTILSIIVWLLIGGATAYFAQQRGRDPVVWCMIGIVLGVLGLLLLFILPPVEAEGARGSGKNSLAESNLVKNSESSIEHIQESVDVGQNHDYLVRDWFYLDNERKQQGPVSFDTLKKLMREGVVDSSTYVWCETMDNWKKIDQLPELKDGLFISLTTDDQ